MGIAKRDFSCFQSEVVSQNWDGLWYDWNNPLDTFVKDQVSELTESFTEMVHSRDEDSATLSGQGVAALGEGMTSVLFNAKTTDEKAVVWKCEVFCTRLSSLIKIMKVLWTCCRALMIVVHPLRSTSVCFKNTKSSFVILVGIFT